MAPVRIERTSKWLKALLLLGMLVMAGAAVLAWQTWGTLDVRWALGLFTFGLAVYLGARFACWWQYG